MWPLPQNKNKSHISIHFSPAAISFFIFEKVKKTNKTLLTAGIQKKLYDLELESLAINNPTAIEQAISEFLTTHNAKNLPISFILNGPIVHEQLLCVHNKNELLPFLKKNHFLVSTRYLYEHDLGKHVWYISSISRFFLLQFQLLAIRLYLNVRYIAAERSLLFDLYRIIRGNAFRTSQFGIDMRTHFNMIEYLFTSETAHRLIQIPKSTEIKTSDCLYPLLSAYTSCAFEGKNNE